MPSNASGRMVSFLEDQATSKNCCGSFQKGIFLLWKQLSVLDVHQSQCHNCSDNNPPCLKQDITQIETVLQTSILKAGRVWTLDRPSLPFRPAKMQWAQVPARPDISCRSECGTLADQAWLRTEGYTICRCQDHVSDRATFFECNTVQRSVGHGEM